MFGNSRVPDTDPSTPDLLKKKVHRHLQHRWRPPIPEHTRSAFARADNWRRQQGEERPLILDSGCGTALSSVTLALRHPDALVIGLDKSESRLARAGRRFEIPANLLLLRADCAIFWWLAERSDWRLRAHYLLYPNPWPKSGHLKRRWHGHPAFASLLALGGQLELRTNWHPYAGEFRQALLLAGRPAGPVTAMPEPVTALTDFERKYRGSGQTLYRLGAEIGMHKRAF